MTTASATPSTTAAAPAATTQAVPSGSASSPGTGRPPMPPSVHVRAVLTWLAIFPLVAIGMTAMGPFTLEWHPVLRALVLTAVVVPLAVYLVVPTLLRWYGAIRVRRSA